MHLIVIRYSEVALKGKNRHWFEDVLVRNIKRHLSSLGRPIVQKIYGRIILEIDAPLESALTRLKMIPGIANFSVAQRSTHDLSELSEKGIALFKKELEQQPTLSLRFKVSTQRSVKDTALNSQQISAQIGADIIKAFPDLQVDLTHPDLELGIEIWSKNRAILYLEKIQGQWGLPVDTSGHVMSFISGGIDSPVASWFMMKRGCRTTFIHFHSYPFIGEQSKQKVVDLVTHLSRYQPHTTLIIVPFAEIQKAVKLACSEKNRTILYRRLMYRIAEGLKDKYRILAYVTGEAVGQVASQTLENLTCTEDAASIPVLRPLIGMDKAEISQWAKSIGTYAISIQPHDDCCTVFQPRKPEIHGEVEDIIQDETRLDLERLISQTLERVESIEIDTRVEEKFWV